MVPAALAVLPGYIVEGLIDDEPINVVEDLLRLDNAILLAPGPPPFHLVRRTRSFDIRMRRVSSPCEVILDPGDPGLVVPHERNTGCQFFRILHGGFPLSPAPECTPLTQSGDGDVPFAGDQSGGHVHSESNQWCARHLSYFVARQIWRSRGVFPLPGMAHCLQRTS